MNKTYLNKLILVFFVYLMISLLVLSGCKNSEPAPTTNSVTPTQPLEVTEPTELTEPIESTEPEEWTGITAKSFVSYTTDYTGTIGDQEITGVLFQSNNANFQTTLTKNAVIALRKYARANGYDGLRVYVYPAHEEGNFVIGGQTAKCGQWNKLDISLANLDSLTAFSSQAKTYTETYMVFEFIKLPAINATSFIKDVYAFSGTIGGRTFDGFVYKSMDYQPTTYFQDFAVEDIKAYAEENSFNALRVHCYPIQKDNAFLVGGNTFHLNKWETVDFSIQHLTTEFAFWSQSQGVTENYMYFEFVNSSNPVIPSGKTGPKKPTSPYFSSTMGYSVEKYNGTVADVEFEGFKFTSGVYQPDFYFTAKAINEIFAAAEESGNNFLRIHSYAVLYDNGFVVGNQHTRAEQWSVTDVNIADLSTAFRFWSQSQGTTEVYLWFEMYRLDIPEATSDINASYFERSHKKDGSEYIVSFYNYAGSAGDTVINGIQIKSGDYQPYFKFSADGIEKIKAYAKENDVNFLKIHSYAILFDNGFVLGNQHTKAGQWNEVDIAVDSLNEEYTFWSQSQGATEIYMWFEFYKLDIPEPTSDIDASYFQRSHKKDGSEYIVSFYNYTGTAGGTVINGIQIKSGDYQPYFKFSAEGIEKIKAYAKEHDANNLIIHSYAILFDNGFKINGKHTRAGEWATTEVYVEELTEDFVFFSESQGATEIYMWFEFNKTDIISASSFVGSSFAISNYEGVIAEREIKGIKATSGAYQPSFTFTESAIARIKSYAESNGYSGLIIHSYSSVYNNSVRVDGIYTYNDTWCMTFADIEKLDTSFTFKSDSEGATTCYFQFEFTQMPAISCKSFTIAAKDFKGTVGDVAFTGVQIRSFSYMPSFYFTETAVAEIKEYAEENGYNTLTIHSYAIQDKNSFVINGKLTELNKWCATNVKISDLTTDFRFIQQGETSNEVYLYFEFSKIEVVNKTSFYGENVILEDCEENIGGKQFVGVKATGANLLFTFTDKAIADIKEFASINFSNTLQIRVYPTGGNGSFKVGNVDCNANTWTSLEMNVNELTNTLAFVGTSDIEVYLQFTFIKDEIIKENSFTGTFAVEKFTGIVAGEEITGFKMTCSGRKRDNFNAEAISLIQAYAIANGYTELKMRVYVTIDNNAFTAFGQSVTKDQWNELTVSVDSLTTSLRIQTTCTGNTEAYFVFEFQ